MVRIISGTHKSILVHPPKGLPVRPTTDRAKESLFNILQNQFDFSQLIVLDLFSGTGNIAYEFASRGAQAVTAVDVNAKCAAFIRATKQKLQLGQLQVVQQDAFTYIKQCQTQFDIVFCDAPYAHPQMMTLPKLILQANMLKPNGWLILEHPTLLNFELEPGFMQQRVYGQSCFSIFNPL
ncbi:MAG: RsmD family RNA methyltransferase [Bacteroidia bacterium]|jgi:16S rRNA (guanine(966)-N(2))-methyltransferase RsmD|nr:RsmD family RNA methyltransferase [Bacteroidia bacterium]